MSIGLTGRAVGKRLRLRYEFCSTSCLTSSDSTGEMMDRLDPKRRSWLMARIGTRHTTPELAVRRLLHRMGYRFRLHRSDLPGTPDIVLPRHGLVVQVHGCFWHGHYCKRTKMPKSRVEYWHVKIDSNRARDARNRRRLRALGWRTIVVWECETKNPPKLQARLLRILTR